MSALKENGHHAKTPEIIFNRSKSIEMNELKILFPTCLTLTGNEMPNWAKGALVKAEIMAGNCNFKQFDATTVLGHDLTVTYGNDEIFLLPFFTSLPLQRSITLQKSDDENVLKVKRITSYVINLPNCKQFNLELSVDTNGIHIVEITPLNNLFEAGTCFENIKSCIGVDIKRGEISAYSMTSKEELKISFNLSKDIDKNIETVFQRLKNINRFETDQTTVIHIDDDCFNDHLIKYIRAAQKFNIGNISFISTQTAELLNILQNSRDQITDNIQTIAYICDRFSQKKLYCQIWKRNGNCFKAEKSYFRDSDCGDDAGSLVKLSNDSNSLDGVDLAFFDNIIDKNVATLLFPNLNFVRTDYYPSHSTAAMIKARIVANNSNGNMLDVENNLNRRITFFINNEIICNFPLGHPLPFTFKSDDITTISSYKICERNAAGTKSETEYHLTENQKKSLEFFCSKNGILKLKLSSCNP